MWKQYLRSSLFSGLAYGLGLGLGNLLSGWIFNNIHLDVISEKFGVPQLLTGIILIFVIPAIGGGLGGFIGGLTLERGQRPLRRWGYAFHSALVFALGYSWILFPVGLIVSLMSFYNLAEIPTQLFSIVFAIVGAIFGSVNGLLLGLLSVGGRRAWRVILAGLVGFGLGGAGFGVGLHAFIYSIRTGEVDTGQVIWLVLGLFWFGLLGGAALGFVYQSIAFGPAPERALVRTTWLSRRRYTTVSVILILIVVLFRPILNTVRQTLTPAEAQISSILGSQTIGTDWTAFTELAYSQALLSPPEIFASADGKIATAWSQASGSLGAVYFRSGNYDGSSTVNWENPVSVSAGAIEASSAPEVVVDASGRIHIVWAAGDEQGASQILYSQCDQGTCSPPAQLSAASGASCVATNSQNMTPELAINANTMMVVWQNSAGTIPYMVWPADAPAPPTAVGCVLADELVLQEPTTPQLTSGPGENFTLIYTTSGDGVREIHLAQFMQGDWKISQANIGEGNQPTVYVDQNDGVHAAWCDAEGGIRYWYAGASRLASSLPCESRPALGMDELEVLHLVWQSTEVENPFGYVSSNTVLYEAIKQDINWSPPVIIAATGNVASPSMLNDPGGLLHLAWVDNRSAGSRLVYSNQAQYDCQDYPLTGINQALYQVAMQDKYRPAGQIIPYCQNRYDQLVFTPNPEPAYSSLDPRANGAYDQMADMMRQAEYEVLFSTMWYDEAQSPDSPGRIVAGAVADLYQQLKTHPERYPRGLTIRILLGNPPEFAAGGVSNQVWYVLSDLREMGVETMIDRQLGWSLEVANFAGNMPHSHVKTLIIDGKTVNAAGYNMTYDHLPLDHPSGLGNGRNDLGIQITGPVAQDAQRAFDDLWNGANRRHCSDLHPPVDQAWQATCFDFPATSTHVPEVLRYYLPDKPAAAFSMYRTSKRDEADQQIVAALTSAQHSIDTVHVNFTLEQICDLNVLFNVCNIENALPYTDALLDAAKNNGARLRILVYPGPAEGIENMVALELIMETIERRGLGDLVEVRMFDGPMHYKASLIDDQFLIVGSQNFHYSAFGEGAGLAEYSLGTDDRQAIQDFQRLFEHHWSRAKGIK